MSKTLFPNDRIEDVLWCPDHRTLALSWKQPFAALMLYDKIETRTWNTKYRGWVLICASKKAYPLWQEKAIMGDKIFEKVNLLTPQLNLVNGKAIAVGRLADCRTMRLEDEEKCFVQYEAGLFCHIYENVQAIEPFDWRGTQGWKEVPMVIKQQIRIAA